MIAGCEIDWTWISLTSSGKCVNSFLVFLRNLKREISFFLGNSLSLRDVYLFPHSLRSTATLYSSLFIYQAVIVDNYPVLCTGSGVGGLCKNVWWISFWCFHVRAMSRKKIEKSWKRFSQVFHALLTSRRSQFSTTNLFIFIDLDKRLTSLKYILCFLNWWGFSCDTKQDSRLVQTSADSESAEKSEEEEEVK